MIPSIRRAMAAAGTLAVLAGGALAPSALADTYANNSANTSADIVTVGSVTTQNLIESYALDYNATSGTPKWADFCGTLPTATTAASRCGDTIPTASNTINTLKGSSCTAIRRPAGSGSGIAALVGSGAYAGTNCVDIARSSRGPNSGSTCSTSLAFCTAFYAFARDSVSYGSFDGSVPPSLTPLALRNIYNGAYTNYQDIPASEGGDPTNPAYNQTIRAVLPQTGSGTRDFFLAAIGVTTPGPNVIQPASSAENNGTSIRAVAGCPATGTCAGVISPYSVADYVAQRRVGLAESGAPTNVIDTRAGIVLRGLRNGTTVTTPCTSSNNCSTAGTTLNISYGSGLTPPFVRTVFNVVRASNTGVVDAKYQRLLNPSSGSPTGYICSNQSKITQYGFAPAASCGARTLAGNAP